MKIHSEHSVDAYLYELRQNFGNSTDFGVERFTGLVLGKFFCVTTHRQTDYYLPYQKS